MDFERIVIAEVIRPRGIRGEIVVKSETDIPNRLETLKNAKLRLPDGSDMAVQIEEAWPHKNDWILKFAGFDSIEAVARLRGADLWVPREQRGVLPEGEFFRSDLIGCTVVDALTRKAVGVVDGWQQYGGGPPLMEVTVGGREVLIPFVSSLCRKVDLDRKTIEIEIADGLLEL
jgi:16S rRNA processing protein RimM